MAPNQRDKNKSMVGVYIPRDLHDRFALACDFFHVQMSSIITAFIYEKVEEYEQTVKGGSKAPSRKGTSRKGKGDSK